MWSDEIEKQIQSRKRLKIKKNSNQNYRNQI
jgi:hypothetical protein